MKEDVAGQNVKPATSFLLSDYPFVAAFIALPNAAASLLA